MEKVTVKSNIKSNLKKVWTYWTAPEHITNWNFATADWHCPSAKNNLKVGGTFNSRMEAKDGSMGFDYSGTYTKVVPHAEIEYALEDGRKVTISFKKEGDSVAIVETFDVEDTNTMEQQRMGWQAILDNFKGYVEFGR